MGQGGDGGGMQRYTGFRLHIRGIFSNPACAANTRGRRRGDAFKRRFAQVLGCELAERKRLLLFLRREKQEVHVPVGGGGVGWGGGHCLFARICQTF